MSITDETLAAVKNLARGYKAVQELADEIESVADIEQKKSAANSELLRINGEVTAAKQALGTLQSDIQAAKDGLKEVDDLAENSRNKAFADGDATRKKAHEDAAAIIKAANDERKLIEDEIADLKIELADKNKERDTINSELSRLKTSLENKKAEIRALAS